MKTILKSIMVAGMFTAIAFTSNAQLRIFVQTRPVEPAYVAPPPPPYHDAVWIGGEWAWRGGHYEYVRPHYEHVHPGHAWVRGHWKDVRGGSVWVGGHWR